jgi:cytochrome c
MKPLLWFLPVSILSGVLAASGVSAATSQPPLPQQGEDAAAGRQLFERRCTGCHSLDQDKEGPRLRTVFGRKAGTVPSFAYSDALKSAQFTWDDAALDRWLSDTNSVVPGNNMEFRVMNAEERAAIIHFLKTAAER